MAHMERIWGVRSGHATEIVENVVQYLKEAPSKLSGAGGHTAGAALPDIYGIQFS